MTPDPFSSLNMVPPDRANAALALDLAEAYVADAQAVQVLLQQEINTVHPTNAYLVS
jgi:hypothetical protein